MSRTIRRARAGVFALAVLGALGFGGSQALASPGPARALVPTCEVNEDCDYICANWAPYRPNGGICTSTGRCNCYP